MVYTTVSEMLRKQKIIRLKDSRLKAIQLNFRRIIWNFYYDQEATLEAIWLAAESDE